MNSYQFAFIGFGNVGKSLIRLLETKRAELASRYEMMFSTTAIATLRHGALITPSGIETDAALNAQNLGDLPGIPAPDDMAEFIRQSGADLVFETTPVDYFSGQPAVDYLKAALSTGKHAITANKGPVVHAYRELKTLAAVNGVSFFFESAVMDGAPIFSLFRETLPAARLTSIKGVLNSTTNLILTRMEQGEDFQQALSYCQSVGIAETDPSGDIEGWDAAVKIAALVTVLMDIPLTPREVDRQGITGLTQADILAAQKLSKRWKLICSAKRLDQKVSATVLLELVGPGSPLYHAMGSTSIVEFETDVLGPLTLIEKDPGRETTAYGMLADMLRALGRI